MKLRPVLLTLCSLAAAHAVFATLPSVDSPNNGIVNGGFEASRFSQGWVVNSSVSPVRSFDGKGVAAFVGTGGRMDQPFRRASQRFTLYFQFAVTQPPPQGRAITVDLRDGGPPLIRLIITAPGQIAVNGPGRLVYPFSNFTPIRWSVDSGGDGSFSAPGDVRHVYTLKLEYDGAEEPYYTLSLTEPGGDAFTRHTGEIRDFMSPVKPGQRMGAVFFLNVTDGASSAVVDNVVLNSLE